MTSMALTVRLLLLLLLSSTCACGYHWGEGGLLKKYKTISVPYVEGDEDGSLTATLIREINASGAFRYCDRGGALTLKVSIIDYQDEHIGFQYDQKKHGEYKKLIIPDETRTTLLAEVILTETATGRVALGPARIAASITFDHDYYATRHRINVFSLGQLTDIDTAQEAAIRPLHRRLAKKVVDYITVDW